MRSRYHRCVRQEVSNQENPSGAKIKHDGHTDSQYKAATCERRMSEQGHSKADMDHWGHREE